MKFKFRTSSSDYRHSGFTPAFSDMVQSNLKGKAVSIGYTGFAEVKNQQIKKKRKKQRKRNERK